ncbi:HNH endonuclease [Halobacteriales archaeon SW_7_71_33]|nr:MAG: HNH endonuclease [Halobacteriales archaeon SW_7_71_33]
MDCPSCDRSFQSARGARQHHTKVHGEPLDNRTCSGCSDGFYDPKARLEYCDDCSPNAGRNNGNWSDAKEETECERCGSEFAYYPSDKDGVYCPDCVERADEFLGTPYAEGVDVKRETKECDYCGERREVLRSEIKQGHGRFCSRECLSEWMSENRVGENHHRWKGGKTRYLGGWKRSRMEAVERDDHECQRCGKTEDEIGRNPDVHHITPVREFEDPRQAHSLDNLVTLCRSCHAKVEHGIVPVPDYGE